MPSSRHAAVGQPGRFAAVTEPDLRPRAALASRVVRARRGPAPGRSGASSEERQPVTQTTEIVLLSGDRYRVSGAPSEIERLILDAARGAIMEFAWLVETETGVRLAINPEYVAMLRAGPSGQP